MGSFDMSCAISGLSIECGTEMKMLLLTENPYSDGRGGFEPTSYWIPRAPAISCEYDDYGRGGSFEEEEIKSLWMKGLSVDMIEQGIGDNQYHDPETTKDMSFESMLDAANEQRLFVDRRMRNRGFTPSNKEEEKPNRKDGIPSFSIVSKILRDAGLVVNGGEKGVYVDEIEYEQTRVRMAGYRTAEENTEKLNKIYNSHLKQFAGTVTKMRDVELKLFPHPMSDHVVGYREEEEYSAISTCMVRQDVWDAILAIKTNPWYVDHEITSQHYKDGMDSFHNGYVKKTQELKELREKAKLETDEEKKQSLLTAIYLKNARSDIDNDYGRDRNPILYSMSSMSNSFDGFTLSLRGHYEIAVKEGLMSEKVLSGISDITYISYVMMMNNLRWMPSLYSGQESYWGVKSDLHQSIADIAKKCKASYDENREEWE